MPDAVPADGQPANVPAPANEKEPDFLFPVASNAEWEAKAVEKTREITDKKTFGMLNGLRVTTWAICAEKKRKELAAVFGFSPGQLAEFPPDCRGKVLEFLAPEQSSGKLTPTEWRGLAKKRQDEVVGKWVDILLEEARVSAKEDGWGSIVFTASTIAEKNGGDTMKILGEGEQWWEFQPLLENLRGLGFQVARARARDGAELQDEEEEEEEEEDQPNDNEDPYVLIIRVPSI